MLTKVPLFADLDEAELARISSKAVTKRYPRNTTIINEGDISDSLYIILSGRVRVYLSDMDGKEVILNDQGPGEFFGEMALLDSAPRSASVVTTEKTELSIISKTDFEEFVLQHPQTLLKILQGSIRRLRSLTENVRSLALLDVYGRVARVLLQLAEKEDGVMKIRTELTQQEIANRVGASREMVSRILKDLRTGGYIEMKERHIIIKETLPPHW
ncbi:MAG: cyclic nucleotide-binding domain-containing protein [Gammaproteobacteria bacterium]|jgi:CRP/FNR family cyclic AMP-dependent transcriptional regulator